MGLKCRPFIQCVRSSSYDLRERQYFNSINTIQQNSTFSLTLRYAHSLTVELLIPYTTSGLYCIPVLSVLGTATCGVHILDYSIVTTSIYTT